MTKYIITSEDKITDKQVIIINGDDSCEIDNDKLIIYNAIKLKPFISNNTYLLIEYDNNLFLIPNIVLEVLKNDIIDSNLSISYLIYCSYNDFMNKVKDKKIDLCDFNSLFENNTLDLSFDDSDSENDDNICYCSIM